MNVKIIVVSEEARLTHTTAFSVTLCPTVLENCDLSMIKGSAARRSVTSRLQAEQDLARRLHSAYTPPSSYCASLRLLCSWVLWFLKY